jgi:hypothetical protein
VLASFKLSVSASFNSADPKPPLAEHGSTFYRLVRAAHGDWQWPYFGKWPGLAFTPTRLTVVFAGRRTNNNVSEIAGNAATYGHNGFYLVIPNINIDSFLHAVALRGTN